MDQQLIMQNNKVNSSTQNNKNIEKKKKKIFHTNASILNLTKNFKSQYHT